MKSFKPWAAAAWALLAAASLVMQVENISFRVIERAPLCPFRFWTGFPCPGCGMTRALIAAFQGQGRLSYGFHPLGIPLLVVWTSWLLLPPLTPQPWSSADPVKRLTSRAEGAALAVILLVYTFRIKTGTLGRF